MAEAEWEMINRLDRCSPIKVVMEGEQDLEEEEEGEEELVVEPEKKVKTCLDFNH